MKTATLVVGTATALAIIAGVNVKLWRALERHANIVNPIEEVVVTSKRPTSVLDLYIATHCPNEFGRLQEFLDCLQDIETKYEI